MADDYGTKPIGDDLRHDDLEYNPSVEPKKSKAWLNLLQESEDAFVSWNDHCDNLDKLFANLEKLSTALTSTSKQRDREYQIFWANAEVIKPAIYAKPPVPVVTPRFMDRRPVYQQASEVAERCAIVAFDLAHINDLMLLVRDDLAMIGRGVAWCRYESGKEPGSYYDSERVCVDFKNRRDFLHSISRNWREVTWVAAASYLTRAEARERFKPYSGDAYQEAEYKVDKDSKSIGGADNRERAQFWEIWDKKNRRVLWVAHGVEDILDEDDPHLDLQNFFPCPKPAFGTCQRGSLVPVPDAMQYRDQLEEVNMLTAKIHALSDAVEVKGFYPAGGGEIADAIATAMAIKTPGVSMVPISNWAAFGQTKDPILWLPIQQIVEAITGLVMLRKQIIDDIYQITGMSDIMRGDTDPQETLGAQKLKSQYGSTRIRDKQQELMRFARDLVEITTEIITEKFDRVTIIEMSQTTIPTKKMQEKQVKDIADDMQRKQQGLQMGLKSPQGQQKAQDPQAMQQIQQQMQQIMQAGQDAIAKIMNQPNLDQVLDFLQDNRTKSFVLDIETDSTIMVDEETEKQSRNEYLQVLAPLMAQLGQLIAADPSSANLCGKILKFAMAPYRVGRELEGAISDYVDQVEQRSDQPQQDDPATLQTKTALQIEQMKLAYAKTKDDADRKVKVMQVQSTAQAGMAKTKTDAQSKAMEVQGRQQEHAARIYEINQKTALDRQHHEMELQQAAIKMQTDAQQNAMKNDMAMQQHTLKATDMQARQQERKDNQLFKQQQANKPQGPL